MHQPRTRVIGLKSDQDPALRRDHGDITASWVVAAEAGDVGAAEDVASLGSRLGFGGAAQDEEVVALGENVRDVV